jgi:hypothetical protein
MSVEWHEVTQAELVQVCNSGTLDAEPDLRGCYREIFGTCHIYTMPLFVWEARGNVDQYHATAGHEFGHCRDGMFHGQARGVRIP